MRRTFLIAFTLVALSTRLGWAYDPTIDLRRGEISTQSPSVVSATPEMWFYEQERTRDDDPKQAVRRNAEARAHARHERIESMKWFGYSNSRPIVSTTPMMGSYSAHWASNTYDPFRWRTTTAPLVVLRPIGVAY